MIRLSAESTAFYQGAGWRSYEGYIGAPILYPTHTQDIRQSLLSGDRYKAFMMQLAHQAVQRDGLTMPLPLPDGKRGRF